MYKLIIQIQITNMRNKKFNKKSKLSLMINNSKNLNNMKHLHLNMIMIYKIIIQNVILIKNKE